MNTRITDRKRSSTTYWLILTKQMKLQTNHPRNAHTASETEPRYLASAANVLEPEVAERLTHLL